MKRTLVRNILGVLIMALWVNAHPTPAAKQTKQSTIFLSAKAEGDKIKFRIHGKVDWWSLAPAEFRREDYRKPSPHFLKDLVERMDEYFVATRDYSSPVPERLKKDFYYLISADGIHLLKLVNVHGEIGYKISRTGDSITDPPAYSGELVARAEGNKNPKGGFVVCFDKPAKITLTETNINIRDYPKVLDEPRTIIVRRMKEGSREWEISRSFGFRLQNDEVRYAFVQWKPDDSCTFRFSILTLDKPLREVAWNLYGCDL